MFEPEYISTITRLPSATARALRRGRGPSGRAGSGDADDDLAPDVTGLAGLVRGRRVGELEHLGDVDRDRAGLDQGGEGVEVLGARAHPHVVAAELGRASCRERV